MRIDKFMTEAGLLSRKECAGAVKRGLIAVDGIPAKNPAEHIDPEKVTVTYRGDVVPYRAFTYLMLNKPAGYVSATDDKSLPYVVELVSPTLQKIGLFPAGRLDRDTTGLLVLTNDGRLAHDLLSPRHHVEKKYRFTCASPLCPDAEERFEKGIFLGEFECKPAGLLADADRMGGVITLTEGKYHQIKRMLYAVGNECTSLERITFGDIPLDPALAPGEYRFLTDEEIVRLKAQA